MDRRWGRCRFPEGLTGTGDSIIEAGSYRHDLEPKRLNVGLVVFGYTTHPLATHHPTRV